MASVDAGLHLTSARLATFQSEHRLEKRRASSQKKNKGQNSLTWPHDVPSPEDLSRAGFYYKPLSESNDNVNCFLCEVKLGGWEVGDIPLDEHLAHSKSCGWALSLSCSREGEDRDPMGEEMVEARSATYGNVWPHEKKKGWKPKVKKMVEAGWSFDPYDGAEDGTTCFYCNVSLDGWEPKDNPLEEHRRRAPDCTFFSLSEQHKSTRPKAKRGRASTASKASRLSTQSVQSTFSEAPSLMSLGDAANQTDMDESLTVDTTITSDAGTTKGRKKTTKTKSTAKGRKKTKEEESVEPVEDPAPEPALDEPQPEIEPEMIPPTDVELERGPGSELDATEEPTKPSRGRKLKRGDESHLEEVSAMEVDPPAKTKKTRGKAKKIAEPAIEPPTEPSEDASQLQSELQDSATFTSALQSPPEKTRGTKRSSDGVEKAQDLVIEVVEEAPIKAKKAARATKAKKGKKAAKEVQEDSETLTAEVDNTANENIAPEQETKPKRGRKPKKAQAEEPESARVVDDPAQDIGVEIEPETTPDIEQPVAQVTEEESTAEVGLLAPTEAEAELHEPTVETEMTPVQDEIEETGVFETPQDSQEAVPTPTEAEFEPTPTPQKPRRSSQRLAAPLSSRVLTPRTATAQREVALPASASPQSVQSSGAENHRPSSTSTRGQTGTAKKTSTKATDIDVPVKSATKPTQSALEPREWMSPTKSSRVPLAQPETPSNALTRSPNRLLARSASPSKGTLGQLTSTTPWTSVDLETILFPSPEKDNTTSIGANAIADGEMLEDRLSEAAGLLTSPEKKMTVEEWIRWRAEMGESKLRGECERVVGVFEREGGRALEVLVGMQTSASS
ncbi:hypothetical protein AAFC00_004324 [Neodothiora populina]|uniref:BIR-domain-containing protein n=1 Tax=Neodothiora populina TaxID=2781224 RepID=A0ABR3PJP9_9PEZI